MIKLAAVDDDRMLLDGLASWLAPVSDLRLVTAAQTVDELLAVERHRADVVLLDLLLADGSDPIRNVCRLTRAGRRVLVVSVVPDPDQAAATFQAGACGYLTKDHDLLSLTDAIRTVAYGGTAYSVELAFALSRDSRPDRPRLSPQEQTILVLYASGMTLQAAARRARVRPDTAKKYLERVKEKYRRAGRPTHTKLDLAARVREDGLLRYPMAWDGS